MNTIYIILLYGLATVVGLVIYGYYAEIGCDPLRAGYLSSQNQLVPYFVKKVLNFPGLPGAFLAVLFGGALSTMSSSLNSAAAITWQDILKYFLEHLPETKRTIATKLLVVLFGAVGIGVAFSARFMGSHVVQAMTAVIGTFSGPTLGLFMLGALFPFANSKGAVIGCFLSTAFNVWICIGSMVLRPHRTTLPTSTDGCIRNNITAADEFNNFTFYEETFSTEAYVTNFTDFESSSLIGNTTTSGLHVLGSAINPLDYVYSISFNLYPLVGLFNTLVIGIIVSLITGCNGDRKVDRRLLIPILESIFCCFPLSMRRRMFGRVVYDLEKAQNDNDNDDDDENQNIVVSNGDYRASRVAGAEEKKNELDADLKNRNPWTERKRETFTEQITLQDLMSLSDEEPKTGFVGLTFAKTNTPGTTV